MRVVGVVEIVASVYIGLEPRYGAYVVAACWRHHRRPAHDRAAPTWRCATSGPLGALTLARLASKCDQPGLG